MVLETFLLNVFTVPDYGDDDDDVYDLCLALIELYIVLSMPLRIKSESLLYMVK